jgi:hypothetical protein
LGVFDPQTNEESRSRHIPDSEKKILFALSGGLLPITVTFSRIVGDILRKVPPDEAPEAKYISYM